MKRFLTSYLNYSPSDVDDHWAASLNMMTRNLRAYTLKAMADDNTRGKIDDGQIQSVFHLREIDAVSGEPLTYLVYGVKDVHHLSNGTEMTDHFVNEYRIRLIADSRSDVNPDGLWIAEYSERPIDGERRDQILNAPDPGSAATGNMEASNDGSSSYERCRRNPPPPNPARRDERGEHASRPRRSPDTFSPKMVRRSKSPSLARRWQAKARL